MQRDYAASLSGAVFFVGLAILFTTGMWWPGIMFVIGASGLARGVGGEFRWQHLQGPIWLIGLGFVFWGGHFNLPLMFVLIAFSMFGNVFFMRRLNAEHYKRKRKHDELFDDMDEKPKHDGRFVIVGEDGELTEDI